MKFDIKKSLKDVVVLFAICAVFGAVLAGVNSITAPIIADQLAGAANEAYEAVMPGATGFEDIDLSAYTLPATVVEAKKEKNGMGYAIKLETKGYGPGMVLIVGVSSDGTVLGATCVTSSETNGDEKTYGGNFTGKDLAGVQSVDTISGSTMTTEAYRAAVVDAINAATIFGGGSADLRTEAEILSDNLNAALGTKGAEFTKEFLSEIVSAEKIYKESSGAGYVALIDGKYVGVANGAVVNIVDAETYEITEGNDELKNSAVADVALISATVLENIDLTAYTGIHSRIVSIQKTDTGNYIVRVEGEGFDISGDNHYVMSGKEVPIIIDVCFGVDGKIIDAQTVSHKETVGYGDLKLEDGKYNSEFIGKDEAGANNVNDIKTGATFTTKGYKQAILRAFEAYSIITSEGGTENE